MTVPAAPIDGPQDRFANLEAVKGETYSGEIDIYNGDGVTPVDLTGYTLTFYLWNGNTLSSTKTCTLDAPNGIVRIPFSAVETAAMSPVAYHFELWADNGEGQVKLILWGWFWVKGECTVS